MGRRVLITGLDTFWGGRMAQALEAQPDVEMILGLGTKEPKVPLERTEFVRSDQKYSILSRIVRATQVDTIVHTFLETNSSEVSGRILHEINVIGTLNLLAAAGAAGASVRKVVVKSSTHVYGSAEQDPTWFREEDTRTGPVRTRLERSLIEVESLVRDFAEDNPHLDVTVLRFANVLGTDIITPISFDLRKRILPCVAGFDPLVQFVEEDDVVRALEFVTAHHVPGVFNVAGEGKLPWSEVATLGGAHLIPFPRSDPASGLRRWNGWVSCGSRRRWRHWPATGAAWTPRSSARPGSTTGTAARVPSSASPEPTTSAGPPVPRATSTATSRTSSSSSGTRPPWCGASTPDAAGARTCPYPGLPTTGVGPVSEIGRM